MWKAEAHTTTASGIVVPVFREGETEGGRPKSSVSHNMWLTLGEVLMTNHPDLKIGDIVSVPRAVINPHYEFQIDRTKLTYDFDGTILVPNNMIETIYGYQNN